ncbi:hypothetical protein E2C01_039144 [Portunus trituberculatus]|uniref:Uncharacterized protein n=1 Tax=Portunus trituberculatus TaxID=210409 RepID=A0A5B7FIV5_PORTR|nr:hypothetical protein [Portunus trituberculatus]
MEGGSEDKRMHRTPLGFPHSQDTEIRFVSVSTCPHSLATSSSFSSSFSSSSSFSNSSPVTKPPPARAARHITSM